MSAAAAALDRLDWRNGRIALDGLTLWLQDHPSDVPPDDESLALFKSQAILDEYTRFFRTRPDFAPRHVFEVGMWNGGSLAFWYDVLRPETVDAVDLADREDDPLLERFLASRGAGDSVQTHWRTDQSDKARLRAIAGRIERPLDLVIDDASHWYEPTCATFEALFPLLRPGGLYVIEDWPWGFLPAFREPDHPWSGQIPLTRFVHDLVELQGAAPGLVARVDLNFAFVAVERGTDGLNEPERFVLAEIQRSE